MPRKTTPLDRMREICRALPDTSESLHFGSAAFRVGKKMFATCGDKDGGWRIVVQLQPEHADLLVSTDPRFERYARQPSCVSMDVERVTDWAEIRSLVGESYGLNARRPRVRRAPAAPAPARTRKR